MHPVQAALGFDLRLFVSILVSYVPQSILFAKQLPGIIQLSIQVVLHIDSLMLLSHGFPSKIRRTETIRSHQYNARSLEFNGL